MGWFSNLVAPPQPPPPVLAIHQARIDHANALDATKAHKLPWVSSLKPVELSLARSHGMEQLATVTSSCWFHYGYSWTEGHRQGWTVAVEKLRAQARALGAHAVLDVKMVTVKLSMENSMDYSLVGTAVRFRTPPHSDVLIATVPALECLQLIDAGVIPTGIAIGARYDWLTSSMLPRWSPNQPVQDINQFWQNLRHLAMEDLLNDTRRQGNGVLAQMQYSRLFSTSESESNRTRQLLGRNIVIGTVVTCPKGTKNLAQIPVRMVLDMSDTDALTQEVAHHGSFDHTI